MAHLFDLISVPKVTPDDILAVSDALKSASDPSDMYKYMYILSCLKFRLAFTVDPVTDADTIGVLTDQESLNNMNEWCKDSSLLVATVLGISLPAAVTRENALQAYAIGASFVQLVKTRIAKK